MSAKKVGPGELAYLSGVSYDYIYKIRKGQAKNVSAIMLAKIANALDTSVDYLLGLTDDPTPPQREDTGARALPPDLLPLCERLSRLPEDERKNIIDIVMRIVEFTEAHVEDDREVEEFERLFALLPEARQVEIRNLMARLLAEQRGESKAAS